jgi:AcrR family transcriptional regulator
VTSSPARERTRRAILDAAVRVLGANPGASLAEVAAAAGVGRTTLHRYFPERADLREGIIVDGLERSRAAIDRARLGEGAAPDALVRLCAEHFELGEVLLLIFSDPDLMADPRWSAEDEEVLAVRSVIERGQAEGTIDASQPSTWIEAMLWALLYTAWDHARARGTSRHEALDLCLRSLRRAIAPGDQATA